VSARLDAGAANAAGAGHGQIASAVADGVAVSAHKLVEEGARAQLLVLPGLLRVDVRPLPDGLQVVPRPLDGTELGWEIDPEAVTDYGKTAVETELPALVRFRIAVWTGEAALGGRLLVGYTRDDRHGPTHFVGHLVMRAVGAER
jgi:hypothetical protein